MREFFELVNEYPWTTIFLFLGLVIILEKIAVILAAIFGNIFKCRK